MSTSISEPSLLNGRYEPVTVLNKGAYGVVTLVRDVRSGKLYAAKCIRARGSSVEAESIPPASAKHNRDDSTAVSVASSAAYSRITSECSIGTARSGAVHEVAIHGVLGSHPNIASLVDHFEADGGNYLILEYCAGGDLYEAIRNGDINSPARIKDLMSQLIDAVAHSHAQGVYHRDIKPENILLGAGGTTLKLADWGLATTSRICSDFGVGSRQYMAPECFDERARSYDAAQADIWAVGVCLLNALFGRNPFKQASQKDRLFTDFAATREALFDIFPTLSRDVFGALRHSLTIDPENRSLASLRSSLDEIHTWTTEDEYDLFHSEDEDYDATLAAHEHFDTSSAAPIAITTTDRQPLRVPTAVAMSLSPLSSWDRREQYTPPNARRFRPYKLGQVEEADTETEREFSDADSSEHIFAMEELNNSRGPLGDVFDMEDPEVPSDLRDASPPSPPSLCESGGNDPDSEDSKDGKLMSDAFFAGSLPAYNYSKSWADEDDDYFTEALQASVHQYPQTTFHQAMTMRKGRNPAASPFSVSALSQSVSGRFV